MEDQKNSRPGKFLAWLANTKFGGFAFANSNRFNTIFIIYIILTHSLYWLTAWWSPWPYVIFIGIGLWFSQGVFKPWGAIISQATKSEWDPSILKIAIPFIVLNYVAFFSCLYMFGTVVDGDGMAISGMWKHFYFSAVTLTTLGYGNLTPSGLWSEIVATIQSLIGFMGFAVLAGIVASIALKRSNKEDRA